MCLWLLKNHCQLYALEENGEPGENHHVTTSHWLLPHMRRLLAVSHHCPSSDPGCLGFRRWSHRVHRFPPQITTDDSRLRSNMADMTVNVFQKFTAFENNSFEVNGDAWLNNTGENEFRLLNLMLCWLFSKIHLKTLNHLCLFWFKETYVYM